MSSNHGSSDALTLLGASRMDYPTDPADCDLQTIPWAQPMKGTSPGTVIEIDCPEFTSVCPKTGQPDFGHILIRYAPNAKLIESKALKLYLFSFRTKGCFHESVVRRIAEDLYTVLDPQWIEVSGRFMPRGGIRINPVCRLGDT